MRFALRVLSLLAPAVLFGAAAVTPNTGAFWWLSGMWAGMALYLLTDRAAERHDLFYEGEEFDDEEEV